MAISISPRSILMKHKYPAIDILALATQWSGREWERFIRDCVDRSDLNKLRAVLYGIQRGMDIANKRKTNSNKLVEIFAIWTRSIEYAAKKIFRKKYPSALDGKIMSYNDVPQKEIEKDLRNKRKRDLEFQRFLNDSRF